MTEMEKLVKKMDSRDDFFLKVEEFEKKNGYVLIQYAASYEQYKKDGKRKWRDVPGVKKKLWKASKKMKKNKK